MFIIGVATVDSALQHTIGFQLDSCNTTIESGYPSLVVAFKDKRQNLITCRKSHRWTGAK